MLYLWKLEKEKVPNLTERKNPPSKKRRKDTPLVRLDELLEVYKSFRDIKKILSNKRIDQFPLVNEIKERTSFLPPTAVMKERLWYIDNNTRISPVCKICNNHPVKWDIDNQCFRTYCSFKCQGQDDEVKRKREKTNLLNIGVSHPAKSQAVKEKYIKTMLQKFGTKYPNQLSDGLLETLNDPKWWEEQYTKNKRTIRKIAEDLSISQMTVTKYLIRQGLSIRRDKNQSQCERDLLELLKSFGEKVIANTRKIIPPNEIDIFIQERKIAFEINGLYWHSEGANKDNNYHLLKTNQCYEKGIKLIHIFQNEWLYKNEIVKSRISTLLGKNKVIYARKCDITPLTEKEACEFFERTHIQGHTRARIYIGLKYGNNIVSVISFGTPRMNKNYEYELIRLASELNTTVIGGAGKLFKHFVDTHGPKSIISYSDKRWNTGNVYIKLGFDFSHTSKPNYWYFKNSEMILYPRMKFQKHKLHRLLPNFNSNLTEWQNMINNGYNRIWDCGNDVWIWRAEEDIKLVWVKSALEFLD